MAASGEKMDDNSILMDAKVLLRATLVSKQYGVRQSTLEHEYKELAGERIPWKKLGFLNLFEFLMSVPDVAKLEWRKEDQDNRVFAVLDKETYASYHAKKMSNKGFGKGSKPLSPEEISLWKQTHGESTSETDNSTSGKKGQKGKQKKKYKTGTASNVPQKTKSDESFTVNQGCEEVVEGKVIPNEGKVIPDEGKVIPDEYKGVLPNMHGLYSLCIKLGSIENATKFSKEEALKLVNNLFELPSCKIIETSAFSNSLLFVRYKTLKELVTAIEVLNGHKVNGITIDVSPAKDRMKRSTPASANDVLKLRQSVDENSIQHLFSSQQQSIYMAPLQQGLLPTPSLPIPLTTHLFGYEYLPTTTVKPVLQQINPSKHGINVTKEQLPTGVNQKIGETCSKDTPKVTTEANGGFIVSEKEFAEMCMTGTKQMPKVASNFPNQIKFIMTYTDDLYAFWIHLLEQNVAITDLMGQLQVEATHLELSNKPKLFPSMHQFGAAKYHEDGLWYRCWVLDSNKAKNQIHVLYCDYGNDDVVPIEHFMQIATSLWSLLPQAIPVRLHGVKIASGLEEKKRVEGLYKLNSLCIGQLLQADVVKEVKNPKSHIIELKNVVLPDFKDNYLEDIMVKLGFLERDNSTIVPLPISEANNAGADVVPETVEVKETTGNVLKRGNVVHSRGADIKNQQKASRSSKIIESSHNTCYYDMQRDLDSNNAFVTEKEIEHLKLCPSLFELNPQNMIRIEIRSIESPELFYVRTRSSKELYRKITERLAKLQTKEKAIPVVGGKACFCDSVGKFRVEVQDLIGGPTHNKVIVKDIDTGQAIWANVDDLYILTEELIALPAALSKAALAGITTKNTAPAVISILNGLSSKEIFAHIVRKDTTGLFHVELFPDLYSKSINVQVVIDKLASVAYVIPLGVPKQKRGKSRKKKSKKKITGLPNGHASGNELKNPVHSESSFVTGSSRTQSERDRLSSKLTLRNDSSLSCSVKDEPPPIWVESNTFGDNELQYANSSVSDKGGDKSGLDKGGKISQERIQDKLEQKSRKVQSSIANPAQDRPIEFNTTQMKKLERDGLEISEARRSTNRVVSNFAKTGPKAHRFRPQSRPLPNKEKEDNSKEGDKDVSDSRKVKTLISSIMDLQERHVITSLINFNDDGSLNRDVIDLEVKRWEIEKERLQTYIDTLKEAVASSDEKSGLMLSRSRKKKLELHVNILGAEKQLEEVTKELNNLDVS